MGFLVRLKTLACSQLLGDRFVHRGPVGSGEIAITFDDGPDPAHTPRIIQCLEAHGARATFFLVGESIEKHKDLVRRMVDAGHEIGNHSMRHQAFASMPVDRQVEEIRQADRVLTELDGRSGHWFRPPQGRISPRLLLALARMRQRVAMWSLDSFDYRGDGVEAIMRRFDERPARPGDVVLFHDDNADTAVALERLLPAWRSGGFHFRTVSELAPGGASDAAAPAPGQRP